MVALPDDCLTSDQYLRGERQTDTKHELINGRVYAMSGASLSHIRICSNLSRHLGNQLEHSTCEVMSNDMRVKIPATNSYTYPDIVIACKPELEDEAFDTLLNPKIIIEVLSPSTELFDRGDKFGHYRLLASLTDYVLVAQNKPRLEHFHRVNDQQWLLRVAEQPDEQLVFESVSCNLKVSDVYLRVQFGDAG